MRGLHTSGIALEPIALQWLTIKGAMDGDALAAYIRQALMPELSPRTVVILDNLATHRNTEAVEVL